MLPNEFLSRLSGVRRTQSGTIARCPGHDDGRASLSVGTGDDGRILVKCFAGCETEAIVSALGLTIQDLFPPDPDVRESARNGRNEKFRRVVESYDYTDPAGELVYQAVRFDPKGFAQRRPDGNGGFVWNLKGVPTVLYHLPEVMAAPLVYLVEGEKDVETLRRHDLPATCNPMGAGKWRHEYSECLRGKTVVILPDNDEPGRKHAVQVANSLYGIAQEVLIVELPGLPQKGDVSDYFENGGTVDELLELAARADAFEPNGQTIAEQDDVADPRSSTGSGLEIEYLSTVEAKDVKWLVPPLIPNGFFTNVDGIEGVGKTYLSLDFAKRLTTGEPMPFGGEPRPPGNVLFLSAEDSPEFILKPRFEAMGGDCSRLAILRGHFEFSSDGFKELQRTIETHRIELVIIDPIFSFTGRADINSTADVRPITDRLNRIAAEYEIAIVGIRHINKTKGFGDPRSAGAHSVAWLQGCRSGLIVGHDAEDRTRRGIAQIKLNVGPESRTVYGYEIDAAGRFRWTGESDLTVSRMLAHTKNDSPEEHSAIANAVRFLREQLVAGGKFKSEIDIEARGAGINLSTLNKAKIRLGIKPYKQTFAGGWFWKLPDDSDITKMPEDAYLI